MKSASGNLDIVSFDKYKNLAFESTFDSGTLFPINILDAHGHVIIIYLQ